MKIFLCTGDISGDFYASMLVQSLKKISPTLSFCGVGSEKLEATGTQLWENSATWSAIGIFDALQKVPSVYQAYLRVKKKLRQMKPDGAVFIDTPAFNVPLARFVRSLSIPSVYFFPPSPWSKDVRRASAIGQCVEKIIAPLKETAELYTRAGASVFFSGHPLLDTVNTVDSSWIFKKHSLDPSKPVLGIFPGSRQQEIRRILPVQLQSLAILKKKFPNLQAVVPIAARELEAEILPQIDQAGLPVMAKRGFNREAMQISNVLMVASGTATLEAALFEKPMVIVYKVSSLSWKLQKPFVKGVRFAGLPNLIANQRIVPELLQEDATPENIAAAVETLFDPKESATMISSLRLLRQELGEPGVMDRVAKTILNTFHD